MPLPRSITPGRCIVFLICLSLTVMLSVSSSNPEVEPLPHHDVQFVPRQDPISPLPPSSPSSIQTSTSTSTSETTSRQAVSSTSSVISLTSSEQPASPTVTPTNSPTPPGEQVSSIQSTGSDGSRTVVVVTVSATGSSVSATPSAPPKGEESSGLGTGSIIGLSVAGGIALLGIIAFFVWKFTRKRRSASYDDGEIKWPDLNSENHISGQDDHAGVQNSADGGSLRDPSFRGAYGDGGLGASQSQVDLYAADPYAVPPLPHLNPNQPYRDDPGGVAYHDGFNPPAFHESRPSSPSIRGEVIPMNQISRTKSPGPQGAIQPVYGGRQSPGPQEAFGGGYGRQSPGPQDAYAGGYGRRSPGPLDAYGPR